MERLTGRAGQEPVGSARAPGMRDTGRSSTGSVSERSRKKKKKQKRRRE